MTEVYLSTCNCRIDLTDISFIEQCDTHSTPQKAIEDCQNFNLSVYPYGSTFDKNSEKFKKYIKDSEDKKNSTKVKKIHKILVDDEEILKKENKTKAYFGKNQI